MPALLAAAAQAAAALANAPRKKQKVANSSSKALMPVGEAVPQGRATRGGGGLPAKGAAGGSRGSCDVTRVLSLFWDSSCPNGKACTNRSFPHGAGVRRFSTADRGEGLRAGEDIEDGQFVVEYTGEVIDKDEKERREQAGLGAYIMDLKQGSTAFIDARGARGLGRLLNHSCDPNCESQAWSLDDDQGPRPRIGLFAIRQISKGEELTICYSEGSEGGGLPFICLCGAAKCVGPAQAERQAAAAAASEQEERGSADSTQTSGAHSTISAPPSAAAAAQQAGGPTVPKLAHLELRAHPPTAQAAQQQLQAKRERQRLQQQLEGSEQEQQRLRQQLQDSERERERLQQELANARRRAEAAESLPTADDRALEALATALRPARGKGVPAQLHAVATAAHVAMLAMLRERLRLGEKWKADQAELETQQDSLSSRAGFISVRVHCIPFPTCSVCMERPGQFKLPACSADHARCKECVSRPSTETRAGTGRAVYKCHACGKGGALRDFKAGSLRVEWPEEEGGGRILPGHVEAAVGQALMRLSLT